MILRNIPFTVLGALSLIACTPAGAPQGAPAPQANQSFSREMSATDRLACTSSGGKVERRGKLGAELCVRPFADAGKQCTDTSQCQGKCVGATDQAASKVPDSGQCQADDRLFGCYSEIKHGKAVNAICVD